MQLLLSNSSTLLGASAGSRAGKEGGEQDYDEPCWSSLVELQGRLQSTQGLIATLCIGCTFVLSCQMNAAAFSHHAWHLVQIKARKLHEKTTWPARQETGGACALYSDWDCSTLV